MHGEQDFIAAFTIVLITAALTTVVFQKLKQPVVMGYLLAGVLVGPYLPTPLVADKEVVHVLSELGVVLLLFSIGLEFSISTFIRIGSSSGIVALIQATLMVLFGYMMGDLLGWSKLEKIFAGAMLAVSSTAVVSRVFREQNTGSSLREMVFGTLIAQDLVAILLMTGLTAVASGQGLSFAAVTKTTLGLLGFLVLLVGFGLLLVPRMVKVVFRLGRSETLIVANIGICFALALLARSFGYSMALGAFIAGALAAESGAAPRIEKEIRPIRDLFTAVFFVSVGMQLDPWLVAEHWLAVLSFFFVVIVGQTFSVALGFFVIGRPIRVAVQAGLSLAQIGEFSFLIAGIGVGMGVVEPYVFAVAVSVAMLTTWTTPLLVKYAPQVATTFESRMPDALQTFLSLYGSWLDELRERPPGKSFGSKMWRWVRYLLLDGFLLVVTAIAASRGEILVQLLEHKFGIVPHLGWGMVLATSVVLIVPLVIGIIKLTARMARGLAEQAFPPVAEKTVDTARSPRKALKVSLHLFLMLGAGLPIILILHPFFPQGGAVIVLIMALVVLGVGLVRSARDLDGHVKAGAHVIAAALGRQMAMAQEGEIQSEEERSQVLETVRKILPGMGDPVSMTLPETSAAVGQSIADINLRSKTGATVMAISSDGEELAMPPSETVLKSGDVLVLGGSDEAIEMARVVLRETPQA